MKLFSIVTLQGSLPIGALQSLFSIGSLESFNKDPRSFEKPLCIGVLWST